MLVYAANHMAATAAQRAAFISSPSAGTPAAPAPQRRGSSPSGSVESGRLGRTRAAMSAAAAMGAVKLPTWTPPTPSEASRDASWMHAGCGRRLHTSILLRDLTCHVRPCPVRQHHVCTRSHAAPLPLTSRLVLCIGCLQPAVACYNLRPRGASLPPPPRSGATSCGAGRDACSVPCQALRHWQHCWCERLLSTQASAYGLTVLGCTAAGAAEKDEYCAPLLRGGKRPAAAHEGDLQLLLPHTCVPACLPAGLAAWALAPAGHQSGRGRLHAPQSSASALFISVQCVHCHSPPLPPAPPPPRRFLAAAPPASAALPVPLGPAPLPLGPAPLPPSPAAPWLLGSSPA